MPVLGAYYHLNDFGKDPMHSVFNTVFQSGSIFHADVVDVLDLSVIWLAPGCVQLLLVLFNAKVLLLLRWQCV